MGALSGFAPWIVFWVLVGNASPTVAALAALGIAVVSLAAGRSGGAPGHYLGVGASATFAVATACCLLLDQSLLGQWLLPLSFVGILAVALASLVTERPFVPEFAPVGPPTDVTRSEPFGPMSKRVTVLWVGTLTAMTVSSIVPPITLGESIFDVPTEAVSIAFSWVLPILLMAATAVATRTLHQRAVVESANPATVRRTSFVAFRELAIDELYYLAREKAEREVGAGMEAYDVNVGSAGVPLTGDESRESWPATYKMRARR